MVTLQNYTNLSAINPEEKIKSALDKNGHEWRSVAGVQALNKWRAGHEIKRTRTLGKKTADEPLIPIYLIYR